MAGGSGSIRLRNAFLVDPLARPAVPTSPEWASGATLALVVDAVFMRAADDSVHHYHRLGTGRVDERQHFLGNSGIVADIGAVGQPALEVRDLGMFRRHNADRELGGCGVVQAVERNCRDRITAEPSPGLLS